MIIYQAIGEPKIIEKFYKKTHIKLNVLISYVYLRGGNTLKITKDYRHMIDNLCLDSGAFSVYTNKTNITRSEYLSYIQQVGDFFTTVFTLDDRFDDPDHNLCNQYFLEDGLRDKTWRPVPSIHSEHDPFGEIETYVEQGHDYIALGSLGPKKKFDISTLAAVKKKYPGIKFHLFGSLNRDILFKFRPYSADASSWSAMAENGFVYYWDDIDEREYTIYLESRISTSMNPQKKLLYSNFHHKNQFDNFLNNTFGYTYKDLLNSAFPREIVNLYYLHQLQEIINNTPDE